MKTVFIYQAELYCSECGPALQDELSNRCGSLKTDDSETWPQEASNTEADSPCHCGACGVFLENSLTPDGLAYVRNALEEATGNRNVLDEWAEFYQAELDHA